MKNCKQLPIKVILFFTISLSILLSVGCGTVRHSVDLQEDYAIKTDAKIEVGKVTNGTGLTFDIDIEKLLADALEESLREEKLLSTIPREPRLIITSKIAEYEPGNAFKRWLMPGWGSTVLRIECDLMYDFQFCRFLLDFQFCRFRLDLSSRIKFRVCVLGV